MSAPPPKDPIGDRMKSQYEWRARTYLPRRTFTILRLDGRAFHTYTRGLPRPFDYAFIAEMAAAAAALCREADGTRFAYVQSDEVSLVLTDFASTATAAWFDGNVQKLVSIAASVMTAHFNALRHDPRDHKSLAYFDARVFTIPDRIEVVNYFIWRQQDATRNSINAVGQAHFSHRELHGQSCDEVQEMLYGRGVNWDDYPVPAKRGTVIAPRLVAGPVTYTDRRTGEQRTTESVERRVWETEPPPVFTTPGGRDYLDALLPGYPD